ncbi:ATP-dependent RNA helicase [Malassezia yamatoensis]|uniref:ATP-dependent RNA helicase n=1 Tax=Malassezia yamatoensis TaxID=253288 RepID=A0AAJ6CGZ6_9BASI|nr:ATP-dependent RNA helicase [Malassezia yamatoensis]
MATTQALQQSEEAISHALGQLAVDRFDDPGANSSEEEEEEDRPAHACAYCGLADVRCCVQCLHCQKWFCNGRGKTAGSHIVMHLVRSRHKGVRLHSESPLGDTVPECYSCGNKNNFVLGFIPAKGNAVVVLLCRSPCAQTSSSKDMVWDTSQWSPLIQDRAFLPWFVAMPNAEQAKQTRTINAQEIGQLEELWRENDQATFKDLQTTQVEDEVAKTQSVYKDTLEYQRIHKPLVAIEADYDRKLRESQVQDGVVVRWDTSRPRRLIAWLDIPQLESGELRMAVGDEIKLKYRGELNAPWQAIVQVVSVPQSAVTEVGVEMRQGAQAPTHCTHNFSAEFVWKGTTFDRMQSALRDFAKGERCMSSYLMRSLLGHTLPSCTLEVTLPKRFSVPGLPELNHSQVCAVKSVLTRPLSLIQGPPGTGKTVTSASIVYHLCNMQPGPVLVCAPSNVAVDQLTEKLHQTGLKVVRIQARSREAIGSSVDFLSLHEQLKKANIHPELAKFRRLKAEHGELSTSDERKFRTLLKTSEREILQAADVICTTCSGMGDIRVKNLVIRSVLMDEATQSTEPESLIPIVHGCKQLVLVGDHKQLGPVIMNRKAAQAGMKSSLFERMIQLGHRPQRLEVQYRMHPCLSEFPSNMFYDGALQNGVTAQERQQRHVEFAWPNPDAPMFFRQNLGQEEISGSGTSFLNRTEASSVEKMVTALLKARVHPSQIGIVTPYEGQRNYLITHMQLHGSLRKDLYQDIEVASVDAFQGREKDYILVSCVRSSERQGIGFLSDPRRLNVALTRARFGLIIVGNPKVLSRDPLWYYLLQHFKSAQLLVEGPLSNLQPSMIQFARAPPAARSQAQRRPNEELAQEPTRMAAPGTNASNLDPKTPWHGAVSDTPLLSFTRSDQIQSHDPIHFPHLSSALDESHSEANIRAMFQQLHT